MEEVEIRVAVRLLNGAIFRVDVPRGCISFIWYHNRNVNSDLNGSVILCVLPAKFLSERGNAVDLD